jgi:hypothetical protein
MLKMCIVSLLMLAPVSLANAKTYTLSSWPDGIKDLPCSIMRKQSNGSWTISGTIKSPGVIVTDPTLDAVATEGRMIEAKCGNKR